MIVSKSHLLFELRGTEWVELKAILGNKERYYWSWTRKIKKRDGSVKRRPIDASLGPLRYLQFQVNERILSKLPISESAHGGVKARDCVSNAKRHLGKKHHWQTDIRDFYPSITMAMVQCMFRRNGFSNVVSSILAELVTYQNRLPQGAPTSSSIANLVFFDCDERINALCASFGAVYGRLVDDITISSHADVRPLIGPVAATINAAGFRLHRGKTFVAHGTIDMPGVRLRNNGLSILPKHQQSIAASTKDSPRYKGLMGYRKHVRG